MTKKQEKANKQLVERIYYENCSGVQISVLDIGKVFKVGLAAIAAGKDREGITADIVGFVQTIRSN